MLENCTTEKNDELTKAFVQPSVDRLTTCKAASSTATNHRAELSG